MKNTPPPLLQLAAIIVLAFSSTTIAATPASSLSAVQTPSASSSVSTPFASQVASNFNASLAANRARNGHTYVNGVANVLIEPGRGTITTAAPVTVIDPRKATYGVNVVGQASGRTVIAVPKDASRNVEIAPVLSQDAYRKLDAYLPCGGVVLPNANPVRPIEVITSIKFGDIVVRRD